MCLLCVICVTSHRPQPAFPRAGEKALFVLALQQFRKMAEEDKEAFRHKLDTSCDLADRRCRLLLHLDFGTSHAA